MVVGMMSPLPGRPSGVRALFPGVLLILSCLVLAACGGDGGDSGGGDNGTGISNGTVQLSWNPPEKREDDSHLPPGEILRYEIGYGRESGVYTNSTTVNYPAETTTITVTEPGTYYFAIRVYDTSELRSRYSEERVIRVN